jgi:signal transduction histidine kinase
VLVCQDNGPGVPQKNKEKIFLRGFGKNTGLGLFLIREILAMTDISIRECGNEGEGSRFEIVIPSAAYRAVGRK